MNQTMAKALYVAGVTTFCTFLGCWAVLVHQAQTRMPQATVADEAFVHNAALGGIAEVKIGELAEEKAANEEVKKFAKRMVEDHTKANEQLKEAATKENLTLPMEMAPKDQEAYETLSKLSGEAFDSVYARVMLRNHQEDVVEFQNEADAGHKDAIKTFAAQTLPTSQAHLKHAQEMAQVVASSSMARGKSDAQRFYQRRSVL
jgi:putative membrane protein